MAESLNESQLLMLDNLIYLDGVADAKHDGKTVGKIVEELSKNDYKGLDKSIDPDPTKKGQIDEYPGYMSRQEWIDMIDAIKNDPKLCSLKVKNGTEGPNEEAKYTDSNGKVQDIGGMRAACFVDTVNNSTTVVFRGTHESLEWHDNGVCGYESDTPQQLKALEYINNLPEGGAYSDLTVTGHSKGGNKAQYVTIASDRVDRCVSFDGQGFSQEFLYKYKDEIKAKNGKITSISAENDFVNCMLNPIAGTQKYIDTEKQSPFTKNHSPNSVFKITRDKDGKATANLRNTTNQGAIPRIINVVTKHINRYVSDPKRKFILDGLLSLQEDEEGYREGVIHTTVAILLLIEEFANPLNWGKTILLIAKIDFELLKFGIEELGKFIIKKIGEFINKIVGLANDVKNAILKFVGVVKIAWSIFKSSVIGLANEVANTCVKVGVAMENFKNKLVDAVSKFFMNVKKAVKEIIAFFKKPTVVTPVNIKLSESKQNTNDTVNSAREEIKKQYKTFDNGTKYLMDNPKKTLNDLGKQAFGSKVAQGDIKSFMTAPLSVDLNQLKYLQSKIMNMESSFWGRVNQILSEVNKVTTTAGQGYNEFKVQQQIFAINKICADIRKSNKKVCEGLKTKTGSLKYTLENYKKIESFLCGSIKA